jgi:hypothetical protein
MSDNARPEMPTYDSRDDALEAAKAKARAHGCPIIFCQEDGFSGRYIITVAPHPGRTNWTVFPPDTEGNQLVQGEWVPARENEESTTIL